MSAHSDRFVLARRRVALVATAVVMVGVVSVVGTTAAHAVTSCSYNGTTDTMTVTMPDAGLSSEITRSGVALTVDGTVCGNAKVGNTDEIVVNGAPGRQSLELSLENGALGPGTSVEGDTPEIEITPHLGAGTDYLTITGSSASDNIRIGTTGVNLNGDADRDVTLDGVDRMQVYGGGNSDTLSASGALGTGGKSVRNVNIYGQDGGDTITGGLGRDGLYGDAGIDLISGDVGDDNLYGSTENDHLIGGSGDDYLYGEAGTDTLDAGDGDDTFGEGAEANGPDTMNGGLGTDYVTYYYRTNPINVTINGVANDGESLENDNVKTDVEGVYGSWSDPNTLVGSAQANYLNGGSVNDDISGGGGKDTVFGNDGPDEMSGGTDDDYMYGNDGSDILDGDADDDSLYGGNGADTVSGGEGDDFAYEDSAPNGADDISLGSGHDSISWNGRTADLTVTLDNNADDGEAGEGDRVRPDVEDVTGGTGKNRLIGSAADNALYSPYNNTVADVINGGAGVDYIYGYGGNDMLTGGDGEDSIYGGDGADTVKLQDGGYDYADGGTGADVVANQDVGIDNLVNVP